ncbi:MAG: D-alanyl-D-alanine carboxypeptidase family protein [Minisyncoccia bacterium]
MKNLNKKTNERLIKDIFFIVIFVIGIGLISYGKILNIYEAILLERQKENQIKIDGSVLKLIPFKEKLSAVSYLVGELNRGKILLKKNENIHFFPASLSKLLTAIITIDTLPLDEEVVISDYALSAEGEEVNFKSGEKLKVLDLLKALLVSSSNDAAIALEEKVNNQGFNFLELAQEKLRQLNMNDSIFFDSTGLDRKGNFTTASDLFLLSREIYKNYPLIGKITQEKDTEISSIDGKERHFLKNTNELVSKLENLWAGKTGSTPIAGDCLLTIYEFTNPSKNDKIAIVIIVLNSSDRFNDTLKLYNWFENVLNNSFLNKDQA